MRRGPEPAVGEQACPACSRCAPEGRACPWCGERVPLSRLARVQALTAVLLLLAGLAMHACPWADAAQAFGMGAGLAAGTLGGGRGAVLAQLRERLGWGAVAAAAVAAALQVTLLRPVVALWAPPLFVPALLAACRVLSGGCPPVFPLPGVLRNALAQLGPDVAWTAALTAAGVLGAWCGVPWVVAYLAGVWCCRGRAAGAWALPLMLCALAPQNLPAAWLGMGAAFTLLRGRGVAQPR